MGPIMNILPFNEPFDLKLTLKCGQGHRWLKEPENPGWYSSVICGQHMRIRQIGGLNGDIEFGSAANSQWVRDKLHWQFGLDDDILAIYGELSRDGKIRALIECYPGLRVMRVDPWECLMFFMMSNNASVQVIHGRMEKLANVFGTVLPNSQRKTFPTATDLETNLNKMTPHQVKKLGLGFDSWLPQLIRCTANSRLRGPLRYLEQMSYVRAAEILSEPKHVADKASNCIVLFSLGKQDAFPIDRHIYRSLSTLWSQKRSWPKWENLDSARRKGMREWVQNQQLFGSYPGYASQFLFIHDYES